MLSGRVPTVDCERSLVVIVKDGTIHNNTPK